MKKITIVFLLAAVFLGLSTPAAAQVSTEGRDFWVALTFASAPDAATTGRELFLAVSAKKDCKVTVSNPNTNFTNTYSVSADNWFEIRDIPVSEWWPGDTKAAVNGKTLPTGLQVTSTEDISLFAAIRFEFSFDASVVLPTQILQTEYYVQDYPPYDHKDNTSWSSYSVLATASGTTTVKITPYGAKSPQTITLKQGQVYYYVGADKISASGTHIVADKPIAVFNGDVCTDVPGEISARDLTYEQAMPVDYWGTEFVVTRSLHKDANRVRVTAMEDGTQIYVDNSKRPVKTINAGETYEFEVSEGTANLTKVTQKLSGANLPIPDVYKGVAHYIKTSCPCAVYSYDVSEKYTNTYDSSSPIPTEVISGQEGDPSMVWISPLEQRIHKITFGVCPTNNTNTHNVNIVVLTKDADKVRLVSRSNPNGIALTFTPVAGTEYSYARQQICNSVDAQADKVFTLTCPSGFIAHVYGNGRQESYSYSAGSSAVKLGNITVGDQVFEDGARSSTFYCLNDSLEFSAEAGATIIDKVDWDFGDGVTEENGPAVVSHQYDSPGWYDVTAKLYAHKECPDTVYPPEAVHFSFYVNRPDTVREQTNLCAGEPWAYDGKIYNNDTTIITGMDDCDTIHIYNLHVGQPSPDMHLYVRAHDEYWFAGERIETSGIYTDTLTNMDHCDSVVVLHLTVVTCLKMTMDNVIQGLCSESDLIYIPYNYTKGELVNPTLTYNEQTFTLTNDQDNHRLAISANVLEVGQIPCVVTVQDTICDSTLTFSFQLKVPYPSSILQQKYDNMVAVRVNARENEKYHFTAYQWYVNDVLAPGYTTSVYYTEQVIPAGTRLSVDLTDKGVTIRSCDCVVQARENPFREDSPTNAPKKELRNGQLVITTGGHTYNSLGERVE